MSTAAHKFQEGHYLFGTSVYSILEFIGEGGFGKMAKCKNLTTKEVVAVKILKQNEDLSMDTESEVLELIAVLDADSTNVVKFFECFQDIGQPCFAFEMLDKHLHQVIVEQGHQPLCAMRPIAQQE